MLEVHIQFWGDSYNINDNQANTANLANAGRWLKLNPNAHILVEAYADDLTPSGRYGEDRHNYNYSLAQKRSAAVITALEYYGASANQLTTRVVGDYEQYYIVYDYNRCVILKPGLE